MQPLTFLVYLISFGIQIYAIFIFQKLFIAYQYIWLGNAILVLGVTSAFIHHIYSFFNNAYTKIINVADGFFLLSNSLVFYAIVLFINHIFQQVRGRQQKLLHKLKYDSLTRALSRDEIMAKCEKELERAARVNEPVSLLTIDMDHFKEINDAYGHPIGDEVLVKSTNYCKEILRSIDLIGRIGGDEFIVLLPNTPLASAREVAERIHLKMKSLVNELSIKASKPISLSIGIACYDPKEWASPSNSRNSKQMLKHLIQSSDKALYEAKKRGNSQCIVVRQNIPNTKMELSALP